MASLILESLHFRAFEQQLPLHFSNDPLFKRFHYFSDFDSRVRSLWFGFDTPVGKELSKVLPLPCEHQIDPADGRSCPFCIFGNLLFVCLLKVWTARRFCQFSVILLHYCCITRRRLPWSGRAGTLSIAKTLILLHNLLNLAFLGLAGSVGRLLMKVWSSLIQRTWGAIQFYLRGRFIISSGALHALLWLYRKVRLVVISLLLEEAWRTIQCYFIFGRQLLGGKGFVLMLHSLHHRGYDRGDLGSWE